MLVPQNLLNSLYVHTVLQHERSGGVAQLVGGVFGAVQSGIGQVLFYQVVDRGAADALVVSGHK